uniref:Uncharacterized LOC108249430 n=1 Tax=Kryptolebias marmoratus TaxID=37003 RepID=A0A3Q3G1N1_KRYMA
MKSFILKTALLLCCSSWICESQTMEVQSGEDVTLLCSNISTDPTQTDWFRVVHKTGPSCISSMYKADDDEASYCDEFQTGKFNMSSNITTIFLQIKHVERSDSGLYFCGFYIRKHTVIGSSTELIIQDESNDELDSKTKSKGEADRPMDQMSVIFGTLSVFLTTVIIVLAVKLRKLQKALSAELQGERNKNLSCNDLNYAALSFQTKAKRNHRSVSERQQESHVVYAATR